MNCLVTKLKAVVNDDSLGRLGCLVVNVDNALTTDADAYSMGLRYSTPTTIKIEGDGTFDNGSKTLEVGTRKNFTYSVGTYKIIIPLNGLTGLFFGSSERYVNPRQWVGVDYSKIVLYAQSTLTDLAVVENETVDFENIASCVNLSSLKIHFSTFVNINSIVEDMIKNGRTSGNVSIFAHRGKDFNGQIYESTRVVKILSMIKYEVYSGNGTTLLYTSNYSNGAWSYTTT